MRVFVWTDRTEAAGNSYYRMSGPLTEAAHQGLIASWTASPDLDSPALAAADVMWAPSVANPAVVEALATRGHAGERVVVVEHDDDLLNVRPDNPFFIGGDPDYEAYQRDWAPAAVAAMDLADLVIVSVPRLREVYQQRTSTPVVVVPNTVDAVLLEVPQSIRRPGERLRAGWGGSSSHGADWRLQARRVRAGLEAADARLAIMGHDYRSELAYPDAVCTPWSNRIEDYYLWISRQHVVVAPLADDEFNRAKSPLKALEAGALGIPVVASDAGPYADFVRHGETGFLCRTADDWAEALRTLEADEDARLAMGAAGRAQAATLTTQEWAPVWVGHLREALGRRQLQAHHAEHDEADRGGLDR